MDHLKGSSSRTTQPDLGTRRPYTEPGTCRVLAIAGNWVETFPLQRGVFVVGRSEEADIRIDAKQVSRRHARVFVGDKLEVEDLRSSNGTFLRGERLVAGKTAPLRSGDTVELGTHASLVIQAEPTSSEEASQVATETDAEDLYRLAERVAPTPLSIVIQGETGVGKEVLARKIHSWSQRCDAPFLALNCALLSDALLGSELFGYEKGAFTGAVTAKKGLLEAATGGTVFLDEIADMPSPMQAQLLRVIEQREVLPVGALQPRPVDVRFVCATHRTLSHEARAGRFRQDLYYRLNGITLQVPPLRERCREIPGLATQFLHGFCANHGREDVPLLTDGALDELAQYLWPGNVRELKNVIERASVLAGSSIEAEHIAQCLQEPPGPVDMPGGRTDAPDHPAPSPAPSPTKAETSPAELEKALEDAERQRVLEALETCGGNQTRAAKMLGMARGTLIKRMERYGIKRPQKG